MGTDVHPYVEVRDRHDKMRPWHRAVIALPRYRNYVSFAILANVRNGFGFAGVPTHETLVPISEPRGLPVDTTIKDSDSDNYGHFNYVWLGDHSFSWLTLKELKAYNLDQDFIEQGIVSGKERDKVRAGGKPDNWCGGKSPMTAEDESMQWTSSLRDRASLIVEWIKRLEQYKEDHYMRGDTDDENIRVVFGFDS